MGATEFFVVDYDDPCAPSDTSAWERLSEVIKQAAYEYGHGGYTGTIAEKRGLGLTVLSDPPRKLAQRLLRLAREGDEEGPLPPRVAKRIETLASRIEARLPLEPPEGELRSEEMAFLMAESYLELEEPGVTDKWGPVGCICFDGGLMFFGFASC